MRVHSPSRIWLTVECENGGIGARSDVIMRAFGDTALSPGSQHFIEREMTRLRVTAP